ncbi:MAG TPA: S-layer homology domain-containing protein, partial [Nevskiaceae bacterium]|nr:S-layer homology domain-containing protein [Nevskiaceae bacterium]
RGIGSVSGVPLDPLGVTNGIAGPGTAAVRVTQFLAGERVGLDDIEGHPREAFIEAAVTARLADGTVDGRFDPDAALTRGQLAQYLVSGFGVRQSRPFDRVPVFDDVGKALAPFVEMVSARGALIHTLDVEAKPAMLKGPGAGRFGPGLEVTREAAAYALVQSLGLQAAAEAFSGDLHYTTGTGQIVAIADQDAIAPKLRGYVQKALDLGLIVPVLKQVDPATTVARFKPKAVLVRWAWAEAAVQASLHQQAQAVDQLGL